MRNSTALTRSETEKQKIETSITQASNNRNNIQAYLNFLMNRSLDSGIILDTASFVTEVESLNGIMNLNTENREELQELQSAIQTHELNRKLQSAYIVPKLNTYLDLGSQGFKFQYNDKTQYYVWGLSLEMNLFAGGLHKSRIQQASVRKTGSRIQLPGDFFPTENATGSVCKQFTHGPIRLPECKKTACPC